MEFHKNQRALRTGALLTVVALVGAVAAWTLGSRIPGDTGALIAAAGPILLLFGLWLLWQGRKPMRPLVDEAGVTFGEGGRPPTIARWDQLSGVTIEKLPRSGADQLFLTLWPVPGAELGKLKPGPQGRYTLLHVKELVEPPEQLAAALQQYGGGRFGRH